MKIAAFTDTYEPQINGVVASIKIFSEELRKKGHNTDIFAPTSAKKSRFVHTFKSVSFINYPGYKIGLPYPSKAMKKDFDIIHVHTPATLGLAGITLAKYRRIPLVGTFHTLFPDMVHHLIKHKRNILTKTATKITKQAMWKYLKWFYNRCDCVIVPTEAMKRLLKRHDIKKEIFVIPTGVKPGKKQSKTQLRKKYGFSQRDKIILHVGRISKEKNIPFILYSLRKVLKSDVKMVITSDGPQKKYLEEYVKRTGLNNVTFTGFITEEKLEDYYNMADIFVFASKSETQGLVLLEAIVNSLPIVALEDPVITEFVEENSIGLVTNKKKFASVVKRLMKDRKLRNRFIKNSRTMLADYHIKNCTRKLIGLYSKLIQLRSHKK